MLASPKKIRSSATPAKPIKLSDAARRLRCHVETLRIRIRDGRLKATRGPHGAYYVSRDDLAALPRPGERPLQPQPSKEVVEESWDKGERYLERNRAAMSRELKLFRAVRADPSYNPRLYHLISVNRLAGLGFSFQQIAGVVGISARHARRLAEKRPMDALRRDLATIRSHRQARLEAKRVVDQLRRQLEGQGFRYHRRPLIAAGHRGFSRFQPATPDEPQPAHTVKGLTHGEIGGLRRAGLTEAEIEAISLVGMGADEVNELMMRGLKASR